MIASENCFSIVQMRLINTQGFDDKERKSRIPFIRRNLHESILWYSRPSAENQSPTSCYPFVILSKPIFPRFVFFSLAQASVKYGIALQDPNKEESLDYILNYQSLGSLDHSGKSTPGCRIESWIRGEESQRESLHSYITEGP